MQKIIIDVDVKGSDKISGLARAYDSVKKISSGFAKDFRKGLSDLARPFEGHLKSQKELGERLKKVNQELKESHKSYQQAKKDIEVLERGKWGRAGGGIAPAIKAALPQYQTIQQYEQLLAEKEKLEEEPKGAERGAGTGGRGLRGFARALFGGTATISMGAASVGLTMFYTALRKVGSELMAEENILSDTVPRLVDVNKGFEGTSLQIEKLRYNISDVGRGFGYFGKEGLQVADAFTKLTDSMPDEYTIMRMSRAYGVALPKTTQDMAMLTRYAPSGLSQRTMADAIAVGMEKSKMGQRSEEFMQSVVTAVQDFSKRMPEVDPRTIISTITAINQMGIPSLRGMGAMTIVQGLNKVAENTSEGMLAVGTELISRQAQKFGQKQGMSGTERVWAAMMLGKEGLGTPAGDTLIREKMKYMVTSQDVAAKKIRISQLTGIPEPMVEAIEKKGGWDAFMNNQKTGQQINEDIQDSMDEMNKREEVYANTEIGRLRKANATYMTIGATALKGITVPFARLYEAPGALLDYVTDASANLVEDITESITSPKGKGKIGWGDYLTKGTRLAGAFMAGETIAPWGGGFVNAGMEVEGWGKNPPEKAPSGTASQGQKGGNGTYNINITVTSPGEANRLLKEAVKVVEEHNQGHGRIMVGNIYSPYATASIGGHK